MDDRVVTLIAGATASGKSAHAIKLALEQDAVIINADSMQVYADLRVLTARPSQDEELSAPHYLFGHVDASKRYSVGAWLEDIRGVIAHPKLKAKNLVLVGGTGLYFKAFLEGLSPVPDVPDEIERELEIQWDTGGQKELLAELVDVDPTIKQRIEQLDRHRAIRAFGVYRATGKPMSAWLDEPKTAMAEQFKDINKHVIDMPRERLYDRINRRFDMMIEQGALDEVAALKKRELDPGLPAMRAIGVGALCDYLDDIITLDEAIDDAKQKSRNYAKRQMTWIRNQMSDWEKISLK